MYGQSTYQDGHLVTAVKFTTRLLNGKIAFDSVRGLAWQYNFYQIKKLTTNEVDVIKSHLKLLSKGLQNIYLPFLKDILKIQNIQSSYQWGGKDDEEAKKLFLATKCNTIEDLHGDYEEDALHT